MNLINQIQASNMLNSCIESYGITGILFSVWDIKYESKYVISDHDLIILDQIVINHIKSK